MWNHFVWNHFVRNHSTILTLPYKYSGHSKLLLPSPDTYQPTWQRFISAPVTAESDTDMQTQQLKEAALHWCQSSFIYPCTYIPVCVHVLDPSTSKLVIRFQWPVRLILHCCAMMKLVCSTMQVGCDITGANQWKFALNFDAIIDLEERTLLINSSFWMYRDLAWVGNLLA